MHGCVLNVIVIAECGGFYGQGSRRGHEGMGCQETDGETEEESSGIIGQM